jgi:hypothetical protein
MGAVTHRFCLTKPTLSAGPRRIVLVVSAIVVALVAVCAKVPDAQASGSIAIQANTGDLWILGDPASGSDQGVGMMAGTSPSMNYFEEVAFVANTGDLWTVGQDSGGATPAGVMPGTSPSINLWGEVAFQAAGSAHLWTTDDRGGDPSDSGAGMMPGTSPSINDGGQIAFQANTGNLWTLGPGGHGDSGAGMAPGTSPSINDIKGEVAFQANTGNLWTLGPGGDGDTGLEMMPGTSPSINNNGEVAFQNVHGYLSTWGPSSCDCTTTTTQYVAPGTSPSFNDNEIIAYQEGYSGNLYTSQYGDAINYLAGMKAGTSPSINWELFSSEQSSVIRGTPADDQLNSGSGGDLIRALQGSDLIRGGQGKDVSYDGPGNDRSYGGPGNDRSYGGPGNDTIHGGLGNDFIEVNKPGHSTVSPGSGTNWVDAADGQGDDRVVCASGSVNYIRADGSDQISRSCRGKGSISLGGVR